MQFAAGPRNCRHSTTPALGPLLHPLEDLPGQELPELVQQALQTCRDISQIDRYVIYTDGSSHAHNKRSRPDTGEDPNEKVDTWAFIVLAEQYPGHHSPGGLQFVGWMAHPVLYGEQQPHWLGASRYGSDVAEKEALSFAGLWRIGMDTYTPTTFRPDSLLAANQAMGEWSSNEDGPGYRSLRAIFQTLTALLPHDALQMTHARGHAVVTPGTRWRISWQEEKRTAVSIADDSPLIYVIGAGAFHICGRFLGMPQLTQEGFDVEAPQLPASDIGVESLDTTTGRTLCTFDYAISFATANVNSLHRGPEGHAGKTEFLRRQFVEHGLLFLGLQETRTEAGAACTDGVLRLCSGADKGKFGTELWVNLRQPFAWEQQQPLHFTSENFQVLHTDPRTLLVRASHKHWGGLLLVAHAPQSGQHRDVREQWWQHLQEIINKYQAEDELFVMLDANAATGPSDHTAVFDLDDRSTPNTPLLRDFMAHFTLCLPSTSSLMHGGQSSTWTNPTGDIHCRIDYVAVPQSHYDRCVCSHVLDSFDLGNEYDHNPVALEMRWQHTFNLLTQTEKGQTRRTTHQRTAIAQQNWKQLFDFNVPTWGTDIETHAAQIEHHVLHNLAHHCPVQAPAAKKSHITDTIWAIRTQKLAAKRKFKILRKAQSREILRSYFVAWRRPEDAQAHSLHNAIQCSLVKWQARFHRHASDLRGQLRRAKYTALQETLHQLQPDTAASELLQQLRPYTGPTNPKKIKRRPLPMIRDADNQVCTTPEAALDAWIAFFGQMEGGTRLSDQEQRVQWRSNLETLAEQDFAVRFDELPSLTDLEIAYRRVRRGKACGPDGVPPEICKYAAGALARAQYTQLLKLCLHGQEPLSQKGGHLIAAWKGRGSQDLPSSYRSLLISSHLGKCIHRTLRAHQSDIYEQFLQAQQIGGRKRAPVVLGGVMMRSFLRCQKAQGDNAGIILLDLQEAFYRLVRPLVVDNCISDEGIAVMANRLGLQEDALHELHALLRAPSAISQANMP